MGLFALWQQLLKGNQQRKQRQPSRLSRRVRLGLERLEDRTVPSVVFSFAKQISATFFSHGQAITTDQAGNLYVTGYWSGTANFAPGTGIPNVVSPTLFSETFVAKYKVDGTLLWADVWGGSFATCEGTGIAVDKSGNVYTSGFFNGTVNFNPGTTAAVNLTSNSNSGYVSKLDSAGNFSWVHEFSATQGGAYANAIALDRSGSVYTTGKFSGTVNFDPGKSGVTITNSFGLDDGFVSKLDTNGNFLWARHFGGTSNNVGNSIAVDGSGNAYTTGFISGSTDFNQGGGSFVLSTASKSTQNIYVSKLDTNGNFFWADLMSGSANSVGQGIAVDGSGNAFLTGFFNGTVNFNPGSGPAVNLTSTGGTDAFVTRLSTTGQLVWAESFGGAREDDMGMGIALDGFDDVFTTGTFANTVNFNPGSGAPFNVSVGILGAAFISELDNTGSFVYAGQLGNGATSIQGLAIAVDGPNHIDSTGYYFGGPSCDFDPGPATFGLNSQTDNPYVSQLTIIRAPSTTTLTSSTNNTSVVGESVTFTATVSGSGSGGNPTGTVDFQDTTTGADLGTGTLQVVNGNDQATLTTTNVPLGSNAITATYLGDATFATSSSTVTQTVNQAATSVAVGSSANASVFGQGVTLTATVSVTSPGSGTPTGTVDFFDSTLKTDLGKVSLNGSTATLTLPMPAVGGHSIVVTYSGDTNFQGSNNTLLQTVNLDPTTVVVSPSVNSAVFGQPVTFTATVSANTPGSGTPTGTVNFLDGNTVLAANVPLNTRGIATFSTSSLFVASHSITATYLTDSNYASSSGLITFNVGPDNTTTAVTLSQSAPLVYGQLLSFLATVTANAPGVGVPVGTVTYMDGGTLLATIPLNANGQSTFTASNLTTGNHSITAVYNPTTGNDSGSTSSQLAITIGRASTTIAIASSTGSNAALTTQGITFTATVTQVAPSLLTPDGTVQFVDTTNSTVLGTVPLVNGTATVSTSTLAVGSHNITAVYSGSSNFTAGPNASLTQVVVPINSTSTTLTASPSPSLVGQAVTLTATISPLLATFGTPTGTVDFSDTYVDAKNNTVTVDLGTVPLSGGTATLPVSTLAANPSHTLKATYSGNSTLLASSTTQTQEVDPASTTVALTSSTGSKPAKFTHSVTFTATVSPVAPGGGTPTGTVDFVDTTLNQDLGTFPLVNGAAGVSTSALTIATHVITATYSGSSNYLAGPSGSLSQVVGPDTSTATTLTSSVPGNVVYGQSVTYSATVKPVVPGGSTPTGSVDFTDSYSDLNQNTVTVDLGAFPLVGGVAQLVTSALLPVGFIGTSHQITASYLGDAGHDPSSTVLVQEVDPGPTTTALVSSTGTGPAQLGQSVTLTATVNPTTSGSSLPTGLVRFYQDGTSIFLGTGTLQVVNGNNQATLTTSSLTLGSHTIDATYLGNSFFGPSGGILTQVVNPAQSSNTNTTVTSSLQQSVFGQPVTFTATVPPVAGVAGTPTGTVDFTDTYTDHNNSTITVDLGSVPLLGGSASLTTATLLAIGSVLSSHQITAIYSGNASFQGSRKSTAQEVDPASTAVTLTSSSGGAAVRFGQAVTFTARVSPTAPGGGTPTGTIDFTDTYTDSNHNLVTKDLGSVPLNVGGAQLTTSALLAIGNVLGSHQITATYSGDGNFLPNQQAASQEVDPIPTAPVLSSTGTALLPMFHQNVTLTATIVPVGPASGTPTGTVTFENVSVNPVQVLGLATLSGGSASVTTNALPVGPNSIAAVYSGDGTFQAGTSPINLIQTILKAGTTTAVSSSTGGNPSPFSQLVTFTATVGSSVAGAGTPTGSVDFFDTTTGADLGAAPLSGGTAQLTTGALTAISHDIQARYSGDGHFLISSSPLLTQTVTKVGVSTTAATSRGSSTYGQSVTLSATVSPQITVPAVPNGMVQFQVDGANFGAPVLVTSSNGLTTASLLTTTLPAGMHTITAVYTGDQIFAASTLTNESTADQTVSPAGLTITASTLSKTYGTTMTFAGTEFSTSGLVNGDTVSSLTLTSTGAAATASVAGGPYSLIPSAAAGSGLSNYTISYVNGSLTVNPAVLTITANNASKFFGTALNLGSTAFTTSGLANNDTVTGVTLTSNGAAASASVGSYPIIPSAATGTGLGNYSISYVNGSLTVKQGLGITLGTLSPATVGNLYSVQLTGAGGSGKGYTFKASGLPSWLKLSSNGLLSGTPTATTGSPLHFSITVNDSTGASATQNYALTIDPALAISPGKLPKAVVSSNYNVQLTATGGSGTGYTFTATGLPSWLTLSKTGLLSGTPTSKTGSPFKITIKVTDSNLGAVSQSYTLTF